MSSLAISNTDCHANFYLSTKVSHFIRRIDCLEVTLNLKLLIRGIPMRNHKPMHAINGIRLKLRHVGDK